MMEGPHLISFLFKQCPKKVENKMWCIQGHVFIGHRANAWLEVGQQSWPQKKKVRRTKEGWGGRENQLLLW